MTPEERAARKAAWDAAHPYYNPYNDRPEHEVEGKLVQAVMEGRTHAKAYQELHPDATPKACDESASRALARPRVRALLNEAQKARAHKTGMDTAWVLDRLRIIVDRCMQKVDVLDKKGRPTGRWTFDSTGANMALKLIAKNVGGFEDAVKIQTDEKTRELLERYHEVASGAIVEGECRELS